jgi:hypothetical protein
MSSPVQIVAESEQADAAYGDEIYVNQVELLGRHLVNESLEFVASGHNAIKILLPLVS